jgi:hypothetical protein
VLSYPGGQTIPAAEYSIVGTDFEGVADEDGVFKVTGMGPGTYQVVVESPGYATSRITFVLGGSFPKSEINQMREFRLFETTGSVDLVIRGQDDGEVLEGVTVGLAVVQPPYGLSSHAIDLESVDTGGVTDENGRVILDGLPTTNLWLATQPFDADDDGQADYGARTLEVKCPPNETVESHLILQPPVGDFPEILATNLQSGYNQPPVIAPSIYFIFSVPMDTEAGRTIVEVATDNYNPVSIPVTIEWTSPIRLEVTPVQPLTDTSTDYDFDFNVLSADGHRLTRHYTFYWTTSLGVGGGSCTDVVTDLTIAPPPEGMFDLEATTFELTWSAVACAGGYRIYARDDRDNQDWVYIKDEPIDFEVGQISTVCTLPARFDRYDVDGRQTPLAGITVTFCVVPLLAETALPGDPHGTVAVSDTRPPSLEMAVQVGNGHNQTDDAGVLEFHVSFSEFIEPGAADPVLQIEEAGGDPAFTLDPATGTWIWIAGRFSGKFVFDLPAGTDASGDNFRIMATDLADLSGSIASGTQATVWQPIAVWGSTFDFEVSPQGWTASGDGWAWGTPTIGPMGGHESFRCWGLNLNEQYGSDWIANLVSPPLTVPTDNLRLNYWMWFRTDSYSDYVRVYLVDGVTEHLIETRHGNSNGWMEFHHGLYNYAGKVINIRFEFTSNSYNEFDGVFVDDVAVEAVEP